MLSDLLIILYRADLAGAGHFLYTELGWKHRKFFKNVRIKTISKFMVNFTQFKKGHNTLVFLFDTNRIFEIFTF